MNTKTTINNISYLCIKQNKMKKLILIITILFMAIISYSQDVETYKITGSFEDSDTLALPSARVARNIEANGATVTITLIFKNTDATDAQFYPVAENPDIILDYKVQWWETIIHDNLPYEMDTTDVTKTTSGCQYLVNGDNYAYGKTWTFDNFNGHVVGGYFDFGSATKCDYTLYITVTRY